MQCIFASEATVGLTMRRAAAISSDLVEVEPHFRFPTVSLFGLRIFRIPLKLEPATILQAWHPRFDADPPHRLLRECPRQVFQNREDRRRIARLGRACQPFTLANHAKIYCAPRNRRYCIDTSAR